MLTNYRISGK